MRAGPPRRLEAPRRNRADRKGATCGPKNRADYCTRPGGCQGGRGGPRRPRIGVQPLRLRSFPRRNRLDGAGNPGLYCRGGCIPCDTSARRSRWWSRPRSRGRRRAPSPRSASCSSRCSTTTGRRSRASRRPTSGSARTTPRARSCARSRPARGGRSPCWSTRARRRSARCPTSAAGCRRSSTACRKATGSRSSPSGDRPASSSRRPAIRSGCGAASTGSSRSPARRRTCWTRCTRCRRGSSGAAPNGPSWSR